MQVKPSQAIRMLIAFIKAKIVPFIEGSPAIGKSSLVHQIAWQYNLKVIDLRLSQCDPTDLMGLPSVINGRAGYAPMNTFPIEGDKIPEGYSGWLLFLDEMNSAPLAVQSSAYKLVLDRMVGQHKLHPNVAIVAAGNKEDDGAITNTISTALQSRMAWMELVVDNEEWLNWAYEHNIHHRITDFIKFKPSALYTFSPDHTDKTYASPRTWEFANRLMEYEGENDFLPLMAGTLSEGVAREFAVFCRIYDSLPKPADIEASPETVKVPDEPSILFALTGSIANNVKPESFNTIVKYIQRMPEEFQVITMREIVRRNKAMLSHEGMRKWMALLPI